MAEPTRKEQAAFEAYSRSNPDFAEWLASHGRGPARVGPPADLPAAAAVRGRAGAAAGPFGPAAGQLDYVHSYGSSEFNKCGQAAIATLIDFYGLDPYAVPRTESDDRDGRLHWPRESIIARIAGQFPPDMVFGLFGTGSKQIRKALRSYGCRSDVGHAGLLAKLDRDGLWADVRAFLDLRLPVAVMVDTQRLGSTFGAHWPVVYRVDGGRVFLANWITDEESFPEDQFLDAWHCWFLPYPNQYCFVTCQPP